VGRYGDLRLPNTFNGAMIAASILPSLVGGDMSRYLALDQLKPGDIILASCNDRISWLIRILSVSWYSHSILVISPTIWFDADDPGAQYRCPESKVVYDGEHFRLGHKIPKGYRYDVFRHKQLHPQGNGPTQEEEHKFVKDLIDATTVHAFLSYPDLAKFLRLLKFRLGETGFAKYVAKLLDKGKPPSRYSGHFCSGLVASCYSGLNFRGSSLNLFTKEPDRISPRALSINNKLTKLRRTQTIFEGHEKELPPGEFKEKEADCRERAETHAKFLFWRSDMADMVRVIDFWLEDIKDGFVQLRDILSTINETVSEIVKLNVERSDLQDEDLGHARIKHSEESVDELQPANSGFQKSVTLLKSFFTEQFQPKTRRQVAEAYISFFFYLRALRSFKGFKGGCVRSGEAAAATSAGHELKNVFPEHTG
jgi:hypothetical protein